MENMIFNLPSERPNPLFRVRVVNLGDWLVTEGWIKSSLFDGIQNKDLLVSKSYFKLWICTTIIIMYVGPIMGQFVFD